MRVYAGYRKCHTLRSTMGTFLQKCSLMLGEQNSGGAFRIQWYLELKSTGIMDIAKIRFVSNFARRAEQGQCMQIHKHIIQLFSLWKDTRFIPTTDDCKDDPKLQKYDDMKLDYWFLQSVVYFMDYLIISHRNKPVLTYKKNLIARKRTKQIPYNRLRNLESRQISKYLHQFWR